MSLQSVHIGTSVPFVFLFYSLIKALYQQQWFGAWTTYHTIHVNRFIIRKPALVICVNTLRCIRVSI